ncbi:MAG: zf-HC2 domain-containing protein [Bryobacteraceae bacterium]
MTSLVTCKEFLEELSDFLDESLREEVRQELEAHLSECPNCWVVCDTTKKTIQIFRDTEPCPIPREVHDRLVAALHKKAAPPA